MRMDARLEAQVWRRARHRCEYCGFPAEFTRVPFQIDHIIAEKHRGGTMLDNLALSSEAPTQAERAELESYRHVGRLMELLKSKARQSLRRFGAGA